MKVWIVGKGKDTQVFEDQNEAYVYRGKLSARNGHHKNIPVVRAEWPDSVPVVIIDGKEKIDA